MSVPFKETLSIFVEMQKKKKCSVLAFHLHDNDILRDLEDDVFVQGRCKGPQVSSVESLPELCLNVTPQRLQEVTPGANT